MSRFTKTRPAEDLHARGEEPELRLVEAGDRAPLGHADQLTVEAVGPAVVAAADRLAALARAAQQARAAVAADVAEGAQLAVVVAQHEHRLERRPGRSGSCPARAAGTRARRTARCERRYGAARARAPRDRGRDALRRAGGNGSTRPGCGPDFVISRMISWPRWSATHGCRSPLNPSASCPPPSPSCAAGTPRRSRPGWSGSSRAAPPGMERVHRRGGRAGSPRPSGGGPRARARRHHNHDNLKLGLPGGLYDRFRHRSDGH